MLEEFTVDNFKSLVNVTFCPRELNLLLGANNSGKTSLCHAMRFLSGTTRLLLSECAIQTAGALFELPNYDRNEESIRFRVKARVPFRDVSLCFEYALSMGFRSFTSGSPMLGVEEETLRVTGPDFEDVALLRNTWGSVSLLDESTHADGETKHITLTASPDTTMLKNVYDVDLHARAHCFRSYLFNWQYYDLWPSALRKPGHGSAETWLDTNGGNLASMIYRLKTSNERRYRHLLECLQSIDDTIDVINFNVGSGKTIFMYFEDREGNSLSAETASHGTMRFLAMLYVILGQPALVTSPLIMIEEPENGIYVGFLRELLAFFEQAEMRPQLVFTSHSPYFIDLFDDRLDSIFILKRQKQRSTITQPDVEQVQDRLEKYPLGEQHFREMLG